MVWSLLKIRNILEALEAQANSDFSGRGLIAKSALDSDLLVFVKLQKLSQLDLVGHKSRVDIFCVSTVSSFS